MYASSAALPRGISSCYPALRTSTRDHVIPHREIRADKTCLGFKADTAGADGFRVGAPARRELSDGAM